MIGESSLLDAEKTKLAIEELFNAQNNQIFLSAFFTTNAFEWLRTLAGKEALKIVVRARPNDFLSGATDLSAIRTAVECGWDIRFVSILHAKVYMLGRQIVVGSGNLTGNGMHLLGSGNLEFNSIIDATESDTALIRSVFEEASLFDENILEKMDEYLRGSPKLLTVDDWWPKAILPDVTRALFCNDFPQNICGKEKLEESVWSGIDQCLREDDPERSASAIQNTQAYSWLLSSVESEGGEARFGALSKRLHDTLADDPTPYRSTVKDLLANLLSYIQSVPGINLAVERPRHSQIVKLVI